MKLNQEELNAEIVKSRKEEPVEKGS